MAEIINLSHKIEEQLPPQLVAFIHRAGDIAASRGQDLYLVGGVVRDLLLGKGSLDLDLVIEGDAIGLVQHLAEIYPGKVITHTRFRTAKLQWDKGSIDLTTARSETYAKPGALPTVKPGSINQDLSRRDFTINAMAIRLNPTRYGELLDPCGGRDDLKHRLIRILHEKSFSDDATRIWRGLRYEQRLNFQLERATLELLKRDIPLLDTISADRIRYEIECILGEDYPEKVFCRADELKVLPKLHPVLKGNGWLAEKFEQARRLSSPNLPSLGLYLSLLAYRLTVEENESLISHLRLPKSVVLILRETVNLKSQLPSLGDHRITPSRIYHLLHGYSSPAITANWLACDLPMAHRHIQLFLNKLRYVKPALTGENLKRMGVAPGPDIGLLLAEILRAKLDGKIATRQDEESLVNQWLQARGR